MREHGVGGSVVVESDTQAHYFLLALHTPGLQPGILWHGPAMVVGQRFDRSRRHVQVQRGQSGLEGSGPNDRLSLGCVKDGHVVCPEQYAPPGGLRSPGNRRPERTLQILVGGCQGASDGVVPEFWVFVSALPYPLLQGLPPSTGLAVAWLRHIPKDGRHLRGGGALLFELGGHVPRDEVVENRMHIDGDDHERKAQLVRLHGAQCRVAATSIGWRPGGKPTTQEGRGDKVRRMNRSHHLWMSAMRQIERQFSKVCRPSFLGFWSNTRSESVHQTIISVSIPFNRRTKARHAVCKCTAPNSWSSLWGTPSLPGAAAKRPWRLLSNACKSGKGGGIMSVESTNHSAT